MATLRWSMQSLTLKAGCMRCGASRNPLRLMCRAISLCWTQPSTRCCRAGTKELRMSKALYIMIGGFLGAGKTTAVLQFARRFRAEGKRAGLITNDQSFGLVDTAMLASHG